MATKTQKAFANISKQAGLRRGVQSPLSHSKVKGSDIQEPKVRIRQRKGETKKDFNKRLKTWKKSNPAWQEYQRQKRNKYQREYYREKKTEDLEYKTPQGNRKTSEYERMQYYSDNILNIEGFEDTPKELREEYFRLLERAKQTLSSIGKEFEALKYDEIFQDWGGSSRKNDLKSAIKRLQDKIDEWKKEKEKNEGSLKQSSDRRMGRRLY